MDWANRLILGDSLLVANSLIEREMMAGKVQMLYMDPPYGVKHANNFQAGIDQQDVKDGDEYFTREPETIKAYRDTWRLGVYSYLSYMRDRLRICRELLHESGSIFVQISTVQTTPKTIQRCIPMTTDPGDLVIDPTCGSVTTAYVAEQWGRR